jgi:hypothetical protein
MCVSKRNVVATTFLLVGVEMFVLILLLCRVMRFVFFVTRSDQK